MYEFIEDEDCRQKCIEMSNVIEIVLKKKNCPMCFNRRHIGRDLKTGMYYPCRKCVEIKKKEKINVPVSVK